jgi:hypothetical protein
LKKPKPALKEGEEVAVRFLRDDAPFVKGQVYQMDRVQAEKFVERHQVAEYVEE